ncbi:MAG: DUF1289 domain-containing protein [Pseudomonadota bacterium]
MANTTTTQSPCISICTLDESDICMGCYRSLDEIIDWTMLDEPAKRQVLENVARRAAEKQRTG